MSELAWLVSVLGGGTIVGFVVLCVVFPATLGRAVFAFISTTFGAAIVTAIVTAMVVSVVSSNYEHAKCENRMIELRKASIERDGRQTVLADEDADRKMTQLILQQKRDRDEIEKYKAQLADKPGCRLTADDLR